MKELVLYNYTKEEIAQLLSSIVILVDTREKSNKHIIEYFDKNQIPYKVTTLSVGDYSFMLPANIELGIPRDIYFTSSIVVERKYSLNELSKNLAQYRLRFENEMLRAGDCKITLMIENNNFEDIVNHKYYTQLNEKSFIASLLIFQHGYNLNVAFMRKEHSGLYIHNTFYYYLREWLLNKIRN